MWFLDKRIPKAFQNRYPQQETDLTFYILMHLAAINVEIYFFKQARCLLQQKNMFIFRSILFRYPSMRPPINKNKYNVLLRICLFINVVAYGITNTT